MEIFMKHTFFLSAAFFALTTIGFTASASVNTASADAKSHEKIYYNLKKPVKRKAPLTAQEFEQQKTEKVADLQKRIEDASKQIEENKALSAQQKQAAALKIESSKRLVEALKQVQDIKAPLNRYSLFAKMELDALDKLQAPLNEAARLQKKIDYLKADLEKVSGENPYEIENKKFQELLLSNIQGYLDFCKDKPIDDTLFVVLNHVKVLMKSVEKNIRKHLKHRHTHLPASSVAKIVKGNEHASYGPATSTAQASEKTSDKISTESVKK